MKREDIKKTFPDATDEQISALLNINSADIGKAKGDFDTMKTELDTARNTIADLEKHKGDVAKLQKTIDDYKAADAQREKDQQAAEARAGRESRFNKVLGERQFAHEYIRDGVFAEFEKALADEANTGKGDIEIFDSITKDEKGVKPGLFKSQNPGGKMSGMGGVPSGDQGYLAGKYKNNPFFEG